jgi:20S proteasome alpha/beta subunit
MTVIAWDGETLAADRRSTRSGSIAVVRKIFAIGNLRCGFAGASDFASALRVWVERGRKEEDFPRSQEKDDYAIALVIEGSRILCYDRTPHPVEIFSKFYAVGSGKDAAMGAMLSGMNASQAVEIASQVDECCGNGVDSLGRLHV